VNPVADNIVQMRAQYGLDDGIKNGSVPFNLGAGVAGDGLVDRFVAADVFNAMAPPPWQRLIAVRVAVVARSALAEKPHAATGQIATPRPTARGAVGARPATGVVGRPHRRIHHGGSDPDVYALLEVLSLPGVRDDGPAAQLDLESELIMNTRIRHARRRLPTPRSQRGTMLIIALIVLVAMTLAGIATMRSVDTATVMAGNIAFRQSALNAADQGVQAAFALLQPTSSSGLNMDGALLGYKSSAPAIEPTGRTRTPGRARPSSTAALPTRRATSSGT